MKTNPIATRIASSLEPDAPAPLYHQVAAIVRWEIEAGRIPLGTLLPTVREVARVAEVNYHTVRRAWEELAGQGVVALRRGVGARVVRAPPRDSEWTPAPAAGEQAALPRAWVTGHSLPAAAAVAADLMARWAVEAAAWPLDATAPPPGVIISLAGSEARQRWPAREADCREVATPLAAGFLALVQRTARLLDIPRVALHGGDDPALADLARQLPRVGLRVERPATPPQSLDAIAVLHLLERDAWEALDPHDRWHPAVLPIAREAAAGPLAGLASEQEWRPAGA